MSDLIENLTKQFPEVNTPGVVFGVWESRFIFVVKPCHCCKVNELLARTDEFKVIKIFEMFGSVCKREIGYQEGVSYHLQSEEMFFSKFEYAVHYVLYRNLTSRLLGSEFSGEIKIFRTDGTVARVLYLKNGQLVDCVFFRKDGSLRNGSKYERTVVNWMGLLMSEKIIS